MKWKAIVTLITAIVINTHITTLAQSSKDGVVLDTYFDNGDRIFFLLPTINGDTINAYTDTGGGWSMIYPWVIDSLAMKDQVIMHEGEIGTYVPADEVFSHTDFHPALTTAQQEIIDEPYFSVPPETMLQPMKGSLEGDAFLGQFFFMNHCWTFDYLNERVILHNECEIDPSSEHSQKIRFKKEPKGSKMYGHPSMNLYIDNQEIPGLFDTGATCHLSEKAQKAIAPQDRIGGSFIAKSVYEKWKTRHPEWRVIEGGDQVPMGNRTFSADMIEVPMVIIGKHKVGPVWFSVRPDQAWSQGMIKTMDKVVLGALGGSALKYLSVTIDYPHEAIEFKKHGD